MQHGKILTLVLLPIVLAVLGLLWVPSLITEVTYAAAKGKAEAAKEGLKEEPLKVAEQVSMAFQQVATALGPSVVSIETSKKLMTESHRRRGGRGPEFREWREFREMPGMPNEDFFQRFFDQPFGMPPGGMDQKAEGSGVIISSDGYILTNNHVVSDADEVEVKLEGGRSYTAKVVGTDPKTDLAVLKIDASDLVAAELGNSESLQVGQWVLAIGSPFNLDHTVTSGIVSAKGRSNVGITDYEDFIQTDAAINPGNSGGPLVDLRGRVIGINTAIATQTGSNAGVGFAIPINMARNIMDSLIAHGHVQRGWLGVAIQNLTDDLAKSFGFEGTKGVLIGDVNKGSPAEKAGLKDGDIITKYAGKPVDNVMRFRELVAATTPDQKAEVQVFRDGKRLDVVVQVGELAATDVAVAVAKGTIGNHLGLMLGNLDAEHAQKLGLEANKGVFIREVEPGSLAARAGLRAGDAIMSLNGTDVADVDGFKTELKKHDAKQGLRLQVRSGEMSHYVLLKEYSGKQHE
jgi:serine protease Do